MNKRKGNRLASLRRFHRKSAMRATAMTLISTGGGAALALLAGKELRGIGR